MISTSRRQPESKGKLISPCGVAVISGILTERHRILRDVEFFRSRISKLEGAAGLGEYLVKVVEQKDVADPDTPRKAEDATAAPNVPTGANDNKMEKT